MNAKFRVVTPRSLLLAVDVVGRVAAEHEQVVVDCRESERVVVSPPADVCWVGARIG